MNKLEKIKALTGFTIEEIEQMSDKDFVLKIVKFRASWMTEEQYQFFLKRRESFNRRWVDGNTLDALDIFGGKVL